MPSTDDLMMRLQQLEDGYYGDKRAAREQNFFDTYGARFSNNRGLGLAILNELDARGIDTSAADEAVQQILDQLRTECNEIIESIKDVQDAAIDNAQRIESIQNVISDAVAGDSDSTVGADMPQAAEGLEIPPSPVMDSIDPEAEFDPVAMGDILPAEEPIPENSGDMGNIPPAEEPAPAPVEEPTPATAPTEEISDIRKKRIEKMKSNWGKTNAQKKKEAEDDEDYKKKKQVLSDETMKNIISAVRGF